MGGSKFDANKSAITSKLHAILNDLKGFIAAISSKYSDKMCVKYNGKFYMIKVVELPDVTITDKDRAKHSVVDDDFIELMKCIDVLEYYD